MTVVFYTLVALFLSALAYRYAINKQKSRPSGKSHMVFYGWYVALWCLLPTLLTIVAWLTFVEPWLLERFVDSQLPAATGEIQRGFIIAQLADDANLMSPQHEYIRTTYLRLRDNYTSILGIFLTLAFLLCFSWALFRIKRGALVQKSVEKFVKALLFCCAAVAVLTSFGIILSVLNESLLFFSHISPTDFFFGSQWSPQTAIREDQVGAQGSFGAAPLFAGTLLISFIAMTVAAPIGLFSAIYLAEYSSERLRKIIKPTLETLAGVPTVVYGFFAALTIAPFIKDVGDFFALETSSESALAAGMTMGIMIIPFISSLSDDVIKAVPQSLRDGSYALGATHHETVVKIVLPAALPGIVGSFLLAGSRAIGETMIVVMAAGLSANLTANPLASVTTVTVQIVTLLVGDQEFDSPKTLAAFALGLTLFVVTLMLNVVALYIVRKHRTVYE